MGDRKQRSRGLLGQPGDEHDARDPAEDPDRPPIWPVSHPNGSGEVEAYEQDWYRSLKLLAERQQAIEAGQDEEPEAGAEAAAESAGEPERPAEAPVAEEAVSAEAPVEILQPVASEPLPETADPGDVASAADARTEPLPTNEPSLHSSDVDARREALSALISSRGLSEADADQIGLLVLDPDREIRRLALEALLETADRVSDEIIRQVLADPADEVRATGVRLSAARGPRGLAEIAPLIAARRWPLTQHAALEVLPGLIDGDSLNEERLAHVLSAVGQIEPAADDAERQATHELGSRIGISTLVGLLGAGDRERLGAARLLIEDGSPDALRALAQLGADPLEEIRSAAEAALAMVGEPDQDEEASPMDEGSAQASAAEHAAESEMIAALVRALRDTDAAVRERARTALTETNRNLILGWVREALRSQDDETPPLAAGAAELLGLSETAGEILARATETAAEAREPFIQALRSLQAPPGSLAVGLGLVDPANRPEAVRLLWDLYKAAALPQMQAALSDPSTAVRAAVLEVLGESEDPDAFELVRIALETDLSPAVRIAATRAMIRAGATERTASLSKALNDPDPEVRATAVEALAYGGGPEAARLVLDALSDSDERVRLAASRQLATVPDEGLSWLWMSLREIDPGRRDDFIGLIANAGPERLADLSLEHAYSPNPTERVLAIELAGRASTAAGVAVTIQALQDPVAEVRRAATRSLAALRSPEAVVPLGGSLQDPNPEVRVGAVRALGVIDHEGVLAFLVSALEDPEIRVRETASEVLTEWSSPAVAKRLAEVLAAPDLRGPAAELLTKMGSTAVELLTDVLLHGSMEVAPIVGGLLERIAGLDRFIERLSSMEPEHRLRASAAIGAIGGPAAVDALVKTLSDPDERVRIRALQLLGDLGDTRALDAVRRSSLTDPVPEVASAASLVLGRLESAAA